MTSSSATDYITKQLFVQKEIVTFRSLSRALAIHVNQAKNELAAFHRGAAAKGDVSAYATYVVTGETRLPRSSYTDEEEEDDPMMMMDEDDYVEDPVVQTSIVLVGEKALEETRSNMTRVLSVHVYSLSPSPLRESGLICTPTPAVRKADTAKASDSIFAVSVGRVVGSGVKLRGSAPLQTRDMKHKAKATADAAATAPPLQPGGGLRAKVEAEQKAAEEKKAQEEKERKEKEALAKKEEKPKATGKLDFSKARTKKDKEEAVKKEKEEAAKKAKEVKEAKAKVKKEEAEKEKERAKAKQAEKVKVKKEESSAPTKGKPQASNVEEPKRGVKRKSRSALVSDDEDEGASTSASRADSARPPSVASSRPPARKNGVRLKRGVVLSDDSDEEEAPKKPVKGKARVRALDSDDEFEGPTRSEREMWDDTDVERVTHSPVPSPPGTNDDGLTDEPMDVDGDMDVDLVDLPKKLRKKKEKKVWPVGSNGLKKRRVVKQKMTVDDKGYTLFQDVSEYESVDEEELAGTDAAAERKAKEKDAKKEEKEAAKAKKEEETKEKKKLKPLGGGAKKLDAVGAKKSGGAKPKVKGGLDGFFNTKK